MQEELKEVWIPDSRSIESMAAFGAENREVELIGECIKGDRKYVFYKDTEGDCWYRTLLLREGKWLPEELALFGPPKKRKKKKKKVSSEEADLEALLISTW